MTRSSPRPAPRAVRRALLAPLALLAATATGAALAPAARAEPAADDPATRAARRHYDRGQKLFGLQKFDEALEQYQKAFDAKPIPDFLFNIGQCHRNLGDYEAAIFSFKRYLKLEPDAPNRESVEALIAELEERQAAEESRVRGLGGAPARGPRAEPGPPLYRRWWFWTGIALVGVAGGVGYYVLAPDGGPPATSLGKNIVFGK